jgi:hypothetical protein
MRGNLRAVAREIGEPTCCHSLVDEQDCMWLNCPLGMQAMRAPRSMYPSLHLHEQLSPAATATHSVVSISPAANMEGVTTAEHTASTARKTYSPSGVAKRNTCPTLKSLTLNFTTCRSELELLSNTGNKGTESRVALTGPKA